MRTYGRFHRQDSIERIRIHGGVIDDIKTKQLPNKTGERMNSRTEISDIMSSEILSNEVDENVG